MARITRVKAAQPRYKTVPVIDPETGQQKVTPVMRSNGEQKTTKRGRPVFMRQTIEDRSQPKPLYKCDHCGQEIQIGTPYKHVTPKSGPYGGYKRTRHAGCPDWKPWDLTNAWWARIARATADFDVSGAETPEDVQQALEDVASNIRELAEESREAASNIEDGFGHPTEKSYEAEERADNLDSWADDIENADVPELPEPEAEERWYVVNPDDGSIVFEDYPEGWESMDEALAYLHSTGQDEHEVAVEARDYTPDEPTEDQMEQWRSDVADAVSVVEDCPV